MKFLPTDSLNDSEITFLALEPASEKLSRYILGKVWGAFVVPAAEIGKNRLRFYGKEK